MTIACMNDPGPIPTRISSCRARHSEPDLGQMILDPAYNPAYSNFCYEMFMPG